MSAKDIFHDAVKNGLTKEGWRITHDPLLVETGGVKLYIDLAAEKVIAAEKGDRKIAVEIKSFLGTSAITEFHAALGQFINYRLALKRTYPDRILYLAVPIDTYNLFFKLPFIQLVIENQKIELIVYNPENEVIVKWKN